MRLTLIAYRNVSTLNCTDQGGYAFIPTLTFNDYNVGENSIFPRFWANDIRPYIDFLGNSHIAVNGRFEFYVVKRRLRVL